MKLPEVLKVLKLLNSPDTRPTELTTTRQKVGTR